MNLNTILDKAMAYDPLVLLAHITGRPLQADFIPQLLSQGLVEFCDASGNYVPTERGWNLIHRDQVENPRR